MFVGDDVDGDVLGVLLGSSVGLGVGEFVGFGVGLGVGLLDGDVVGSAVHVPSPTAQSGSLVGHFRPVPCGCSCTTMLRSMPFSHALVHGDKVYLPDQAVETAH